MQLADAETEFPPGEVTFEMSNLSPRETGLDFVVFVSPRMASHAARIKVTLPPWGSKTGGGLHPIAVRLRRGRHMAVQAPGGSSPRLGRAQPRRLLAFWDGGILYDEDLRKQLAPLGTTKSG